jgi:cation diffusion facilitator CzcD-associated flavoprotein CzcO
MPRISIDLPIAADLNSQEASNPLIQQYFFRPDEIEYLRNNAKEHLIYRKQIEAAINRGFAIFYKDTEASKMAEWYMRSEMEKRLGQNNALKQRLIPSWPVGCRRLTPGDGYLEALIEPNVQCHFKEIASINETGLTLEDGSRQEVDVIICATGFDMAWTPHFKLHGINGVDIKDAWSPIPQSYMGIAAPGFPNYWVMNGPRGNLGNGTVLPCLETQIEYVIAAAKKMQADRIQYMDVKADVTDRLNEYIDKWMAGSVFSGGCKSWYKNNTVDGKVMCWGGSVSHAPVLDDPKDTSNDLFTVYTLSKDPENRKMGALQFALH